MGQAIDPGEDYFADVMENFTTGYDHGTEDPLREYAPPAAIGFIFTFGLVANAIAILVNCVLEDYKKTSHWYVLNLAFADSVFLLMLPIAIIDQLVESWILGEPLCVAYSTIFYANYYAGIFFLTVMSFDRYVAIVHPMSSAWGKFRSKEGCWATTAVVWILAITASLPLILNTKVVPDVEGDFGERTNHCVIAFHRNETEHRCLRAGIPLEHCDEFVKTIDNLASDPDDASSNESDEKEPSNATQSPVVSVFTENYPEWLLTETQGTDPYCNIIPYPAFVTWIYSNFFLTYVLPVLVMSFCYGGILWRVRHPRVSSSRRSSQPSTKSSQSKNGDSTPSKPRQRSYHRVTVLVILLVVTFLVCWTPYHAMQFAKVWGLPLSTNQCKLIMDVAHILAYSNSLLNPLLYTFFGASFHKRASKVWNRIKSKNSSTKGYFGPLKNSKSGTRGSIQKTNKATGSSDTAGASNFKMQMEPPPYKDEQGSTSV